jgi:hypothetical protein
MRRAREAPGRGPAVGVADRGGHQFGELDHPSLGGGGERLQALRCVSHSDGHTCPVPRCEQRDRLVGLEPQQSCRVRPYQPGELLADRREQPLVRDRAGGERRHPPEGHLFGNDRLNAGIGLGRRVSRSGVRRRGGRDRARHALSVAFLVAARVIDPVVFCPNSSRRSVRLRHRRGVGAVGQPPRELVAGADLELGEYFA